MPQRISLSAVWSGCVSDAFNVIAVGNVFREKSQVIALGGEDGAIRLYQLPQSGKMVDLMLQPWKCLESKGGPIQSLILRDVTKFGSVDVITGDSRGVMTILSNGQILDRRHLSDHSIISLQVDEDLAGNMAIVAGDSDGLISGVLPFNDLWKLKLKPEDNVAKQAGTSQPSVKALQAFSGSSSSAGNVTNYILACDDQNCLHVLQQGTRVLTLPTPGPVTAMCSGIFKGNTGEIDQRFFSMKEVALGCHSGTIYIMKEFKHQYLTCDALVTILPKILSQPYANVQLPIMHLRRLPSVRDDGLDSILCAGQFRAVLLLHNGQISVLTYSAAVKSAQSESESLPLESKSLMTSP